MAGTLIDEWSWQALKGMGSMAADPVIKPFNPYGAPIYATISAMMANGGKNISTGDVRVSAKNGVVHFVGPSTYTGTLICPGETIANMLADWPSYLRSVQESLKTHANYVNADFDAVCAAALALEAKYKGQKGCRTFDNLQPVVQDLTPSLNVAPKGELLEVQYGTGTILLATEIANIMADLQKNMQPKITVQMNPLNGDPQAVGAALQGYANRQKDFERFADKVAKELVARYPQELALEKQFDSEVQVLEKQLTDFYTKNCDADIQTIKGARDLAKVI